VGEVGGKCGKWEESGEVKEKWGIREGKCRKGIGGLLKVEAGGRWMEVRGEATLTVTEGEGQIPG